MSPIYCLVPLVLYNITSNNLMTSTLNILVPLLLEKENFHVQPSTPDVFYVSF